jgi:hypothetical protein
MTSSPLDYPDWKAPREDGQFFLWPEPATLAAQTIDNNKRLNGANGVLVQGVPLAELRRRARAWNHHENDAQPLVADGHQTELHHAGVWVKRVLTNALAARVGGQASHFAIDTDAPKHLHLRWMGGSEPISDDPELMRAHWAGMLDAPSPAHVDHLEVKLAAARFAEPPVATEFLASLRRLAIEQPKLSPALTNAMHELDWSLGLRHGALLASPLWQSDPFLVFAHHVIARARDFATSYNAALADFRREKKVRTPTRPMPDLAAFEASVELPFWLDDLATGDRTRPSVFARDGAFVLATPAGDEFEFDPSANAFDGVAKLNLFLRRNNFRLSPRALTLTMFLRLLVVDQFVHGIGGGQYDQITDRIIASHFRLDPPRFSVATGTLYLPEAVGRERICVPCIEQQGHRLRHSLLGERKRELVEAIAAAPRNSPERYATFASMHRELKAAQIASPKVRQWEQQLRDAVARETAEAAIFDRELFYGLQPRARLEAMVERVGRSL